MSRPTLLIAALLLVVPAPAAHAVGGAPAGHYAVRASDSYVGYRITKLGAVPISGQFGRVTGEILLDPESPDRSRVRVEVPLSSLRAGNDRRTETLLSPDFFDAERHPKMHFVSARVTRHADGRWLASGDLTIRGVTRTVTFPVEIRSAEGVEGPVAVFSTGFVIDRREFGVLGTRWSGGRELLSNEVELEIALTAERTATR